MAKGVVAQTVYEEQGQLIRANQNVGALGADLMGDKVNTYTGELEFVQTDVSLPGNNVLPVSVGRRYVASTYVTSTTWGLFSDWDLEIPHIHGIFAGAPAVYKGWTVYNPATGLVDGSRCTNWAPPRPAAQPNTDNQWEADEFWNGNALYIPGIGDQSMLKRDAGYTSQPSDGYGYGIVTKSNWQFRCLTTGLKVNGVAATGDGFIAVSPDGTQYRFDWMVSRAYQSLTTSAGALSRNEYWILPTLVTDRFGNTVTYNYDTTDAWKLTSIAGSDGRTISLTYVAGTHRVQTVFDGTRTWTYGYAGTNPIRLVSATLPDTSAWQFAMLEQRVHATYTTQPGCSGTVWNDGALIANPQPSTITHPSGAVGTFTMSWIAHGHSSLSPGPFTPCTSPMPISDIQSPVFPIRSLTSKTISGQALASSTWSYSWGPPNGSWYCGTSCPTTKTLTVTDPESFQTRYTFSNVYQNTDGLLLQLDEGGSSGTYLRSTATTYRAYNAGPYPSVVGFGGRADGGSLTERSFVPIATKVITQQGVNFSWQGTAYDVLARVTGATRSSSLGSKTESTTYADNTTKWIMGQVASQSVSGILAASTSYDPTTALPTAKYQFGKLQASYVFNSDGTLYTMKDGLNQTTTFSNYKRGLAQNIAYADSTAESAVVNDIGLITSLTRPTGPGTTATTGYLYDAIGRLAKITPPNETGLIYNPTTISFQQIATAEYGLGAGHWRQTITTGNGVTVKYFDNLWRARLTNTYDAGNVANTQRMQLIHFDAESHETFRSYPQRTIASISATPAGVQTYYEGLGRPYKVVAGSELGGLTTNIDYLTNFQKKVTNPRTFPTTSSYQAFDQPSESAVTAIGAPEGVSVSIARDVFGKPTGITRSGAYYGSGPSSVTRNYVYDANQLLCKTVEPEIGATIQVLDAANNVSWSAAGLALTSTTSCDTTSVAAASKTNFGYDLRNRLLTTTYGDGSPSISRTYTPDGLLSVVTSNSSTLNYYYNNRRLFGRESLSYGGNVWTAIHDFNANGHVSQLTYPDGVVVTYAPNALGEATQVSGYATGVTYQPNGAVAGYTLANGIVHSQTQNTRGLPLVNSDSGVMSDAYTYDAKGNINGITDQQQAVTTRSMGYDGLDRLTTANDPNVWGTAGYAYDALDNIRIANVGSRSSTFTYDAQNRLSLINTNGVYSGFAYDSHGNITGKGSQGYFFDQGNRMQLANNLANYTYDGLGRRTSIASSGGISSVYRIHMYSRDGQLLWGSWQQGMTLRFTKYIYLAGKEIAETNSNSSIGTTFVHADALGSPVAQTNSTAAILTRTRYEGYGNTAAGTIPSGIGFTGHVNDTDTGLVYMQQRYYDPIAGRFLSVDPVVTETKTGSSFNRYVYGNNNPYRYTDPDGRESVGEFIDRKATEAAGAGNSAATYGWAFAGVAWKAFGAEGISQIADKGSAALTGDKVSAGLEVIAAVVPGGKLNIGTAISAAERTVMNDVFKDTKALSDMSPGAREAAAKVFDQIASKEGQHELGKAFNEARAAFMRGEGPNPGANAIEFGKRNDIPLPGKQKTD